MNKNKNTLNNFTKNIFEIIIVFLIIKSLNNEKIDNRDILSTSILIFVAFCFIKNIFEEKDKNIVNTELIKNKEQIIDLNKKEIDNNYQRNILKINKIDKDIYFNMNNDNRIKIKELEQFTNKNNKVVKKDKYLDIDTRIKEKFQLQNLNKIQLEEGEYIIDKSLDSFGYNKFSIIGDKLTYSDSNKKYIYTFDKKLRRYIDNEYMIIFLKNKDFFIDQDLDEVYFKKRSNKDLNKESNKELYLAEIDDLDQEITDNAKIRYYTYRKFLDKDGKEKYKLINNKYYDKSKNDKVLIDLNTLPHDKRQEKYDKNKIYGYSYVPPNKWYDVPSRKENCITSDDGPYIRPVLSDGTPYDVLYWQKEIEKQ